MAFVVALSDDDDGMSDVAACDWLRATALDGGSRWSVKG